jgi:hypothetical protein
MPTSDVNEIRQYLDKSGCPVCARLKKCQSDLLGGDALTDARGLCNFHAWALAKSAPAVSAANIFLSALRQAARGENACSFCARLSEIESHSIAALRQLLTQQRDKEWMHRFGRLCLAHARDLERLVGDPEKDSIREIVQRIQEELDSELATFLQNSSATDSSGGGVLGRAAEFLASQRGLGNLESAAGRRK